MSWYDAINLVDHDEWIKLIKEKQQRFWMTHSCCMLCGKPEPKEFMPQHDMDYYTCPEHFCEKCKWNKNICWCEVLK